MTPQTAHVDPAEMPHNPAFTHGVIAPAGPTLSVGGQNSTESYGELVERIEAQTTQAMSNVLAVLAAAGTGPEHVVKLTIYLTAGLARPDALVEVDATALIP